MDEERLVNLWNEYQSKRDTYTPEQQEAMENKFWVLVEKAMAEKQAKEQPKKVESRYSKASEQQPEQEAEPKPYRVTL